MTLLAPLIFVAFYGAIVLVAINSGDSKEFTTIEYLDKHQVLSQSVDGDTLSNFIFKKVQKETSVDELTEDKYLAFMKIEDKDKVSIDSLSYVSAQTPSISKTEKIKSYLAHDIFEQNLSVFNVSDAQLKKAKPKVHLKTLEAEKDGELKNSNSGIKSVAGMAMAFIIYMFTFIYGTMVMRSTIEEKTNRIVEVIVSSVKPFQLMLGKILGVAAVGLTQFSLWIILGSGLTALITFIVASFAGPDLTAIQDVASNPGVNTEMVAAAADNGMGDILSTVSALPFAKIITVFILFFMGGFLLYSSLFAAIGSAVNQDTDAQQFMFPVSMPLIFGFIIAQSSVFQDPNGVIATIFSYIPFTSPVVMCARSAFGVSWLDIFLSFAILVSTFLFMVWLSARIYRVGILMYGKKPKWKDFAKWIVRKN